MPDWTVSSSERLDTFLVSQGAFDSRNRAQRAIEEECVSVNDIIASKPSQQLKEGDRVTVTGDIAIHASSITPQDLHLQVLYEDDACLVIEKPEGIAVHPGAGMADGEMTLLHGIAHLFQERGVPFSSEAVLAHRLDKETTGCILVAKSPAAHQQLQEQFAERTIEKTYLALVAGIPSPPLATIDSPIGRSAQDRTKMAVIGNTAAREARTTYRTLGSAGQTALLACDLHTGRTHQIRVHLSAVGHPVLGDQTYKSPLSERVATEFKITDLCLHAWRLAFTSPADGERKQIIAPMPKIFRDALQRAGIFWVDGPKE
ncbi:MAG: RluA family pseudouridine synthase [Candidatus Peregrinibacteria bacterium]|nr:RluA family pseudouridine synthase [Candidatus Peregrinibacteria bacterium]